MPYEEQELEDGLLHDWLSLTIPNGWGWAIVNKGNKPCDSENHLDYVHPFCVRN